jgi:hypothetical protein
MREARKSQWYGLTPLSMTATTVASFALPSPLPALRPGAGPEKPLSAAEASVAVAA